MKPGHFARMGVCVVLAGCVAPSPEAIVLLNDSGDQIVVTSGDDIEAVLAGKAADLPPANGRLIIETAKCKYVYTLPREAGIGLGTGNRRLGLQIEPDSKLYAISPDAKAPARIGEIEKAQPKGFPLMPEQTSCH